jgi:hypothetical protein
MKEIVDRAGRKVSQLQLATLSESQSMVLISDYIGRFTLKECDVGLMVESRVLRWESFAMQL